MDLSEKGRREVSFLATVKGERVKEVYLVVVDEAGKSEATLEGEGMGFPTTSEGGLERRVGTSYDLEERGREGSEISAKGNG
ncbi:hypothetical protein E2C01_087854 [Portunus trituberculatus]|uniref:Uncharacterized protein n=1 Tax=Portunus trituberculatus TaxID=210409 RepID=A0A5B7JID4_PORTR|nr:hypothetical protein [Portunus trituberculatus]